MAFFSRSALALSAACFLALGMWLAARHPLWPLFALILFYTWAVVSAWVPRLWLWLLPAAMPWLSFSPWTGWFGVDEFDLALLATLAGGYARLALQGGSLGQARWGLGKLPGAVNATATAKPKLAGALIPALLALLTLATLVSLGRGLAAGGVTWDTLGLNLATLGYQSYADPVNSLRIFKSFGFAALFGLLLQAELQTRAERAQASNYLGWGMCTGLAVVTLVVLWERLAYPGWLEFSTRYRTTALFWEMQVGGAAIDAYLALATPFVVWALASAKRLRQWLWPALLALLACYAALTTFARGVYLATALPLALLGLVAWAKRPRKTQPTAPGRLGRATQNIAHQMANQMTHVVSPADWHGKAGLLLALLMAVEVAVVFSAGTFMRERLVKTDSDLSNRLAHWSRGLALLDSPQDWLWGRGLGRLPADYARISDETEFSGSYRWVAKPVTKPIASPVASFLPMPLILPPTSLKTTPSPPRTQMPAHYLALAGPLTNADLGGLFSLAQRIDLVKGGSYQVRMHVKATVETELLLKVCEKHLLYERQCQSRYLKIPPDGEWRSPTFSLLGRSFGLGDSWFPRFGVFSVAVLNEGGEAHIANLQVFSPTKQSLIENSDFSHEMAHWYPSASSYYLPWHIDNMYLELLIERGVVGFLLFCVLVAVGFKRLASAALSGGTQMNRLAPFLAASLLGVLILGLISSVLDVPRVAFLFFLGVLFSFQLQRDNEV